MKNRIRKWLGIDIIEATLNLRTRPTERELRRMVGEAFRDALNNKSDEDWGFPVSTGGDNILILALKRAAIEASGASAQFEVQRRIGSEEFIDEVVARIQRKQIGA